jgi:NACHT domain
VTYGLDLAVCQDGTRTAILERIKMWGEDVATRKQIFWLAEAAGTGKTTIAVTMMKQWRVKGMLAGRFFFTQNLRTQSELEKICPAIARDMAYLHPSLRVMIDEALDNSSIKHSEIEEQFEMLILAPLAHFNEPAILIIDALDNCEEKARERLLKLFLAHLPSISKAKLLFTSRTLVDIEEILSPYDMVEGRDIKLHKAEGEPDNPDITLYVEKQLAKFTLQQRQKVVMQSQGLFIWVSTACQLLRQSRRPAQILHELMDVKSFEHLDNLYMEVLQQALVDRSSLNALVSVLQVIVTAVEPVSIRTIEAFLPHRESVGLLVQDLSSVVKDGDPDRPLFVLHDTFREFVASPRANGYTVNSLPAHAEMAVGCLDLLSQFLEYDKFRIGADGLGLEPNSKRPELRSQIEGELSAALKYASSHWAHHSAFALDDQVARETVERFMRTKVLNLAELMSLREMFHGFAMAIAHLVRPGIAFHGSVGLIPALLDDRSDT